MAALRNNKYILLTILYINVKCIFSIENGQNKVNDDLDQNGAMENNVLNQNEPKRNVKVKRDVFADDDLVERDKMIIAYEVFKQRHGFYPNETNTATWEPILYKFTTIASHEVGRLQTWFTEMANYASMVRFSKKYATTDGRPENPDDTWQLGRPSFKGDMVGKPFHDPPWNNSALKHLYCHIDDCKGWFTRENYKGYVLHMYDHFFHQENFYVTWPPIVNYQNFTCYNKSCLKEFREPGDFFEHVHEHLVSNNSTVHTTTPEVTTIDIAHYFSEPPTSTPNPFLPIKCYMCNETHYSRDSIDKHIIKHAFNGSFYYTPERHTMPPPQCYICNLKFSSEVKEEEHNKEVHPVPGVKLEELKEFYGHDTRNNPDPEGFRCHMCPKIFQRPRDLGKHILWHARKDPFNFQPKPVTDVFIRFGKTFAPENEKLTIQKYFTEPPHILAELKELNRQLDEIDVNYTTPRYPQQDIYTDLSGLSSERMDTEEKGPDAKKKYPLSEEYDSDIDPNIKLWKPPKLCPVCYYITNDTIVFNKHYEEHCWDVIRAKMAARSKIYDRMDEIYMESDRLRKEEEARENAAAVKDLNLKDDIRPHVENVRKRRELDFEKIKMELKTAMNELTLVEDDDHPNKDHIRKRRELDFEKIKMELRKSLFTVPFEPHQKCEHCDETYADKRSYIKHVKEHISNQSFFDQYSTLPPTTMHSLEFEAYHTLKPRNASEEKRFNEIGREIQSDYQDWQIARRRGLDNRTREQYRKDRAIELGLKFGLLRTRKPTLPPPPPPPTSKEVQNALNKKLNDVKEKLKQYQERKNQSQNKTSDASKEIDNKINDLKKKMDDIKKKYNTSSRTRSKRSISFDKQRMKKQWEAELKDREDKRRKMGLTMSTPKSIADDDRKYDLNEKKKKKFKRELTDEMKEEFEKIRNQTYFERFDEHFKYVAEDVTTKKPKTTTTQLPYSEIINLNNGTTVTFLKALNMVKSKVGSLISYYYKIHNLKNVTWNDALIRKYNMTKVLEEKMEIEKDMNKTALLEKIQNFQYFDQFDEEELKDEKLRKEIQEATTISCQKAYQQLHNITEEEHKRRVNQVENIMKKLRGMKNDLYHVIMKHFTKEELAVMDPDLKDKILNLVSLPNITESKDLPQEYHDKDNFLGRKRRQATDEVRTPRPFLELCSECTINFTQKTEYYKHEFEHILNESFIDQIEPLTLSPSRQYEIWKAEKDNQTVTSLFDIELSKKSIPMFDDNANVEDMKKYFVTKMHEISSKYYQVHHGPIEQNEEEIRKYSGTYWDQYTIKPMNRTEIVEVFRRVHQYYANQDRLEKEQLEKQKQDQQQQQQKPENPKQRRKRNIPETKIE